MMQTYQQISQFLTTHEGIEGLLTIDKRPCPMSNQSAMSCADTYIQSFGFMPLNHQWKTLDAQQAKSLLTSLLYQSLAYQIQMMPFKTAQHIANMFIALFDNKSATYLTNGQILENGRVAWNAITHSTMDLALVIIDPIDIGIICFEDED